MFPKSYEKCRNCGLDVTHTRKHTTAYTTPVLTRLTPAHDWLRAGRSGDQIPVGTRFSAPVQTGPGAHPASCTMGTGSFPRVKSGRGVTLTPYSLLVSWSKKSRAIPPLPLRDVRPVQSLSACTRVHFIFTYLNPCLEAFHWDLLYRIHRKLQKLQAEIHSLFTHFHFLMVSHRHKETDIEKLSPHKVYFFQSL